MASDSHREAYVNVLAAHLSHHIEIPFFDTVLGPDGGKHITCNVERDDKPSLVRPTEIPEPPAKGKKDKAQKSKFANVRVPRDMPSWFDPLCAAIEQNAATPGIFRIPGSKKTVERLQHRINDNNWVDFASDIRNHKYNVHVLVSLLKAYLSAMIEPLIPCYQHPGYMDIMSIASVDNRIEATQILLLLCPPGHRKLLRRLLACLREVASQTAVNQMDLSNAAVCIAPTILRPSKLATSAMTDEAVQGLIAKDIGIVTFLIQNADKVFKVPSWLSAEVSAMKQLSRETRSGQAPAPDRQCFVSRFVDAEGKIHDGTDRVLVSDYEEIKRQNTEQALQQLRAQIEQQATDDNSKEAKSAKKLAKKFRDIAGPASAGGPGAIPATPSAAPPADRGKTPKTPFARLFSRTPKQALRLFSDNAGPAPTPSLKAPSHHASVPVTVPPTPATSLPPSSLDAMPASPFCVVAQETVHSAPAIVACSLSLPEAQYRASSVRSPEVAKSLRPTLPLAGGLRTPAVHGAKAMATHHNGNQHGHQHGYQQGHRASDSPLRMLSANLDLSRNDSIVDAFGMSDCGVSDVSILSFEKENHTGHDHNTSISKKSANSYAASLALAQMVNLVEMKRSARRQSLAGQSSVILGTRYTVV